MNQIDYYVYAPARILTKTYPNKSKKVHFLNEIATGTICGIPIGDLKIPTVRIPVTCKKCKSTFDKELKEYLKHAPNP